MSVSAGQLVQHAGPGASTETQLSLGRLCALHFSGELFMRHRRAFGISMFFEMRIMIALRITTGEGCGRDFFPFA